MKLAFRAVQSTVCNALTADGVFFPVVSIEANAAAQLSLGISFNHRATGWFGLDRSLKIT